MTMHPMTKIACIVCLYALGIGFSLIFYWVIHEQLQAISQSSVVQLHSGTGLLLFGLILPVFHFMEILDKKILSKKVRAKYRKMQGKILLCSVIILIGSGFAVTQMVMSKIHEEGYQKCEFSIYNARSVSTFYSKDPALCPTS